MPSALLNHHLSRIDIARIDEPEGQWLRQRLHQLLGGSQQAPLYHLVIVCESSNKPWALDRHGQAVWQYIGLTAEYTLTSMPFKKTVRSGSLRVSASLPISAPYYSQTIGEESMTYRLRERLAQQLYSRLMVILNKHIKKNHGACTTSTMHHATHKDHGPTIPSVRTTTLFARPQSFR